MPQNVSPQVVDAVNTTSTATLGQATSMAMAIANLNLDLNPMRKLVS